MELSEYQNIFENEASHFIYVSRHTTILSLFGKYVPLLKHLAILDAGCGTGLLAKKLESFGKVWAVDASPEAVRFTKSRGIHATKASVMKLPFKKDTFHVVISIDVIYHNNVKNDQKALQEFFRVLKPEGTLILRVPANKWLHLAHDTHVHTRQRYDKNELRYKLRKAGFTIQKLSFTDFFLLPLAVLKYLEEKVAPPSTIVSGVHPIPTSINKMLCRVLSLESFLIPSIDLPFGLGLVAVCRKPSGNKVTSGKESC